MNIEFLKWDSDFFGIKIGKLIINEEVSFDPMLFKKQVNEECYELVYVFKFNKMLEFEQITETELALVDIQLTMSKKFEKHDYYKEPYEFKTNLTDKERFECYKIAEATSIVSRFYNEKKIGKEKTKELYRKWIDNSLNHSFSDGIFLFKETDSVIGIHLIKVNQNNNTGYFTLTGVRPDIKGKGIGSQLWKQSFGYFAKETEINVVMSPFSIQNTESFNFHLKMGFNKIEETKFIYHYKKNNL